MCRWLQAEGACVGELSEVWVGAFVGSFGPVIPYLRRSGVSHNQRQRPQMRSVGRRLVRTVTVAGRGCPSIQTKRVTLHTLRHTAAMRLLLTGDDITVIALWLGHEQLATTNIYLHVDMLKGRQALIDRVRPTTTQLGRQPGTDTLLAFLEGL